jgi:hypothetical protein
MVKTEKEIKAELKKMYGHCGMFATPTNLEHWVSLYQDALPKKHQMTGIMIEMGVRNYYVNIITDLIITHNIKLEDL